MGVFDGFFKQGGGPGASRIPDLPLLTHKGRRVDFYSDCVRGRSVVINFFYLGCGDICPSMMVNLLAVQDLLKARMGRDLFFLSLTLQPDLDTPQLLGEYARALEIGRGWTLLTGRAENIETIRRKLGFTEPDPILDADISQHIGMLRYGNEPKDRWAGCPALARPEVIARYVEWLIA